MYFLSLLTIPYSQISNIWSFNTKFDGTMTSQHLVPVDDTTLEEELEVENLVLEEALTSTDEWGIEAVLPPTDDTGLKENVPPREDTVVMETIPPTDGTCLGKGEFCFEVCLLNRVRREA